MKNQDTYSNTQRTSGTGTSGTPYSFDANAELVAACDDAMAADGTLHVFGLLSPGGVHSHEAHIHALLRLAKKRGVPRVAVHAFLDGRDMPPKSAAASIDALDGVYEGKVRDHPRKERSLVIA